VRGGYFCERQNKKIDSLGVRWFFSFFYALSAIGTIFYFNLVNPASFSTQLIIHSVLLFLLLLGLFAAFHSSEKINEIYHEETQNRSRIDEMKKTIKNLQSQLDTAKEAPDSFIERINRLQENLRFLSPVNTKEAVEWEQKFMTNIQTLAYSLSNRPCNFDEVETNIRLCERTYQERKQIYSN
jgi:hypothetical protein